MSSLISYYVVQSENIVIKISISQGFDMIMRKDIRIKKECVLLITATNSTLVMQSPPAGKKIFKIERHWIEPRF